MKNFTYLLLSLTLLLFLPTPIHAKTAPKTVKEIVLVDYFIYHGISNTITKDMGAFTKKFAVGFRNKGCNITNISNVERHNKAVAEALSLDLGNDNWIKELPFKIMGVN